MWQFGMDILNLCMVSNGVYLEKDGLEVSDGMVKYSLVNGLESGKRRSTQWKDIQYFWIG